MSPSALTDIGVASSSFVFARKHMVNEHVPPSISFPQPFLLSNHFVNKKNLASIDPSLVILAREIRIV